MNTNSENNYNNDTTLPVEPTIVGKIVFFRHTETYWDKLYPMKRSDVYKTRSVILKGKVTEVSGREFKAILSGNNGFEKDGEEFVFHMGSLLVEQNFQDHDALGQWNKEK